jgi:hypothetical protein
MARVADRVTGDLDDAGLRALREHLRECSGCAAEAAALWTLWDDLGVADETPSAILRARFDAMLAREIAKEPEPSHGRARRARSRDGVASSPDRRRDGVAMPPRWARPVGPALGLALAAALALALGAGAWLGSRSAARRGAEDIAVLRGEIRSLRSTVALALLAERSPSERLSGVAHGREIQAEDDRVADALFETLHRDPNVNVRLAALDALRELADRPAIRARLLEAIPEQDSPLVQISVIDAVLEAARTAPAGSGGEPIESPIDPAARDQVTRLAEDPALDAVVRGYLLDRIERSGGR